jgi:protein TonB
MWLNQAPDGKKFAAALGLGLLLELAALGLMLPLLAQPPPPAQTPAPIKLTIVAPPAPKPPPPTPKPLPPKPVTPPQPVTPLPPPRPVAQHIIHHVVPPRPVPPPKTVQPPPQLQAPPPPQPAAPSQGQVDLFRLEMKAAVQAVANSVYPQSAQMQHETGVPEVRFVYLDGVVSDIALAQSCGYPLLDEAAMQAVRIAHYPPEPENFNGQAETVTVSVIFQMAASTVDGD